MRFHTGKWRSVWWPKARLCTNGAGVLRRGRGRGAGAGRPPVSAVGSRAPPGGLGLQKRPGGPRLRGWGRTPMPLRKAPLWAASTPQRGSGGPSVGQGEAGSVTREHAAWQLTPARFFPHRPPSPSPYRASPSRATLLPADVWGHLWFATPGREGVAGIEWLQRRLAARHPAVHGAAPHGALSHPPNGTGAQGDKV